MYIQIKNMGRKIRTFGDNKIKKQKFYHYKILSFRNNVDFDNIMLYNRISSSEKIINFWLYG